MSSTHQPRRRGRPASGGREAILDAAVALMREQGISKLTSRAVAERAGVSDASVYYHFKDRPGLLRAVYAHGMTPPDMTGLPPDAGCEEMLSAALDALEAYYMEKLPILYAARADPEVAQALAAYMEQTEAGPHRGVGVIGDFLRTEQNAGRASPAADADAVALMVMDVAMGRATRRLLTDSADDPRLPSTERLLTELSTLLAPPAAGTGGSGDGPS